MRSLRAVRPERRRRRWPFLLLSSILVGAILIGVVTLQALVSQSSFRMQLLVRQNAALRQHEGELQLTVSQLSSPERIFEAAKKLGFELPVPGQVHQLTAGTQP